jgi:hypothetical protein
MTQASKGACTSCRRFPFSWFSHGCTTTTSHRASNEHLGMTKTSAATDMQRDQRNRQGRAEATAWEGEVLQGVQHSLRRWRWGRWWCGAPSSRAAWMDWSWRPRRLLPLNREDSRHRAGDDSFSAEVSRASASAKSFGVRAGEGLGSTRAYRARRGRGHRPRGASHRLAMARRRLQPRRLARSCGDGTEGRWRWS